jgi:hypothetical protein
VYTSSVLRGAPYAFIKFHLLIKKKIAVKAGRGYGDGGILPGMQVLVLC